MMRNIFGAVLLSLGTGIFLIASPATAFAQAGSGLSLKNLVNNHIIPIGNTILELLFAFAFLFFIFGVMQYYFLKPGDAKAQQEGRTFIMWGIIALVVLFSVWGIVNFGINIISSSS